MRCANARNLSRLAAVPKYHNKAAIGNHQDTERWQTLCLLLKPAIGASFLCLALTVSNLSVAHKIGSHETGAETPDVPSVETCATFAWTKKRRCGTYDTTKHDWQVVNNCPRAVKIRWADNSYDRPIRRGEESGKPRAEKSTDLRPGRTRTRSVECVDRAELEICIEYVYPPLQEHAIVDCDDFFD